MPVTDLPDASTADADVTSDSLDAASARATMNPDINEDGLPDQPALDDEEGDGEDDDLDDDDVEDDGSADPDDADEIEDENARNDLASVAGVTVFGRP